MERESSIGTSDMAQAFFAGRYADVLEHTIDSARGGPERAEDLAFVVGALAFVGRVTEAELLLEPAFRGGDARTAAAGGFFLTVAHCRAADVERGIETLARAERASRADRDAWSRSLLHQAAACCHYFASEHGPAERATIAALRNAQRAQFPYAQLLANDMRGHLLLRRGRFLEAFAVLSRARKQAEVLSFTSNAHAIEIAIGIARARLAAWPRSIEALDELLANEHAQDGYSRRAIVAELALRCAYAGRVDRARALLDADATLYATDGRARAALACARAHVARVTDGWSAVEASVGRAREGLPEGLDALRDAELAALSLGAARARGDAVAAASNRDRLQTHLRDGLYRAGAWLHALGEAPSFSVAEGDEATIELAAVARGDVRAVIDAGLLALVPECLGAAPGRHLVTVGDCVVVIDRGRARRDPALAPRCQSVLEAVADGRGQRAELLRAVWGIRNYDPDRHDSVIKTTVSRLRSALGPAGAWIETDGDGYRLAPGVTLHLPDRTLRASVSPPPPLDGEVGARAERRRRILASIRRHGDGRVGPLSRSLGLPRRTVSRELGEMTELGWLERVGKGPATRYRARVEETE